MRKQLAAFIVAGATIAGLAGAPAAHAEDTATSFTLTGGALSISVPVAATLTGAATAVGGVTASGQLGATTVTDARGSLVATWTTSVDGTDFTTGTGTVETAELVPDENVTYSSGLATATTGVVVATPGLPLDMSASRTAMAGAGVGNNTVTWNPTLTVNVPAGNVAGTYTGTITHSVA